MILGVASTTAGCFISPINRAPVVTSIDSDGPIVRGQAATFTATASDPDSDAFDISWAVTSGDCPDSRLPGNWPQGATSGPSLVVAKERTMTPFCVWAFATDRYGAIGPKNRSVLAPNLQPMAIIDLTKPGSRASYPRYTTFQLSGAGSSDPEDQIVSSYEWTLSRRPSGSMAKLSTACGAADVPDHRCLFADLDGEYAVSLRVGDSSPLDDPHHFSALTPFPLTVLPDRAPCITMTAPDFSTAFVSLDPMAPNKFTVGQVTDDGDPFPNLVDPSQTVSFTWSTSKDDEPLAVGGSDFRGEFTLAPRTSLEGLTGRVRLEVRDRNPDAINSVLNACGDAAAFCPPPPSTGEACYQRVTWTIRWR